MYLPSILMPPFDHGPFAWVLNDFFLSSDLARAKILIIANLAVLAGSFIHEAGHWTAARLYGLQKAEFVFFPRLRKAKQAGVPIRFSDFLVSAGINVDDGEYFAQSRFRRRIMCAAGPVADWLLAVVVCSLLTPSGWPDVLQLGVAAGCLIRAVASLVFNVVPLKLANNDGWRILHPDAVS